MALVEKREHCPGISYELHKVPYVIVSYMDWRFIPRFIPDLWIIYANYTDVSQVFVFEKESQARCCFDKMAPKNGSKKWKGVQLG